MNPQTHRLIFNKSRVCSMAAGQHARSIGGADKRRTHRFVPGAVLLQSGAEQMQLAKMTANNAVVNNRQLHPDERKKARELTAKAKAMGLTKPDGSAYTQEDIEDQMRLMGNAKTNELSNTVTVLTNTAAIEKSLKDDPGMPKTALGPAVMEVPGQANAQLQSWIIDNTRDGFQYIPGQSPYSPSNAALNGPKLTTDVRVNAPIAKWANGDFNSAAGMPADKTGRAEVPELSPSARQAIADEAANTSRQAGVIGSGATAATAVVAPVLKPVTGAVAVGATVIGVAADVVEQVVRPDTGQTVVNSIGTAANEVANKIFPITAPVVNEAIERAMRTDKANEVRDSSNQFIEKVLK